MGTSVAADLAYAGTFGSFVVALIQLVVRPRLRARRDYRQRLADTANIVLGVQARQGVPEKKGVIARLDEQDKRLADINTDLRTQTHELDRQSTLLEHLVEHVTGVPAVAITGARRHARTSAN